MKNFSFSIYNIASILAVLILVYLIILPFNLINMEQAQRIAKWKSVYEQLNYSFSLEKLHENDIIPMQDDNGKIMTEVAFIAMLLPYLNLKSEEIIPAYKYSKMNGQSIKKSDKFYFNKFYERKDGVVISIKENVNPCSNDTAVYYMFVDINGKEKPNRIGRDIFIININKDNVSALGNDKSHAELKTDCSPIGSGFYCSEYYLLGGRF